MCTCNIKIPMQAYKWGMTGLYNVLALHIRYFPCTLAAGRDGGEGYPTPAEGYPTPAEGCTTPAEGYPTPAEGCTTPAEGWSNSATRRRTSREDSSTQQAT